MTLIYAKIDNLSDTEAQIFMDTMKDLRLQQHVSFQTHHAGNILDLIFTEATSQFGKKIFKSRYVSDHRVIVSELSIGIQHITGKMVTFRNLKQINVEEFESTLDLGSIKDMRDLELVNRIYEEEFIKSVKPSCTRQDQIYH